MTYSEMDLWSGYTVEFLSGPGPGYDHVLKGPGSIMTESGDGQVSS